MRPAQVGMRRAGVRPVGQACEELACDERDGAPLRTAAAALLREMMERESVSAGREDKFPFARARPLRRGKGAR